MPETKDLDCGLSLVELLVLMGAVTVLVCALMSGIVSMHTASQARDEETLAFDACRNALEDLRDQPLAAVVAANGRGFAVAGISGGGVGLQPRPGDADGLAGHIEVTPYRVYGTSTLYRVVVAVDWVGVAPKGHVHVSTLMGERR